MSIQVSKDEVVVSKEDDRKLIVVDIAKKQKRKSIRSLRRGKGRLMGKINDLLDEMREQGAVSEQSQPIVVVVRQKEKRWKGMW